MLKGKFREKNLNYEEVAKMLSISITTLSNKMNGVSEFTITEVRNLKDILALEDSECIKIFL
jgi:hypothetical protein